MTKSIYSKIVDIDLKPNSWSLELELIGLHTPLAGMLQHVPFDCGEKSISINLVRGGITKTMKVDLFS
jgi:hypothetical protein